jgi:nicotinate-nucleotide adenylyltransferase
VRLGILGGSFDPPHVGHLLAASDAYDTLHLDRLLFIPSAAHPFKRDAVVATPSQRLEMLTLALENDTRFGIDPVEIEREGLSYTIDTLADLAQRYPDAERFLLIGEDLVEELPSWRSPARIQTLAEVVVLVRGEGNETSAAPFRRIHTRRIDVSSTEVRARVREGRSIRGFVAESVARYIRETGLYR